MVELIKGKWYRFRPYSDKSQVWYLKYRDGEIQASEYISCYDNVVKYVDSVGNFSKSYNNDTIYELVEDISEFAHFLPEDHADLKNINKEVQFLIW